MLIIHSGRFLLATLGVVAGLVCPSAHAEPQVIRSPAVLEAFTQHYYRDPQPQLVGEAIEFLSSSGLLKGKAASYPYFAFFAGVFGRHPDRMKEWEAVIARQDAVTRDLLGDAIQKSHELKRLVMSHPPTAGRNDLCWGAFFATGNSEYLVEIVKALRFMGERQDDVLFMFAATAKWSLANLIGRHPEVQKFVEFMLVNVPPPIRDDLADVIGQGAGRILQDMDRIVRAQRARGLWMRRQAATDSVTSRLDALLSLPQSAAKPAIEDSERASSAFRRAVAQVGNVKGYCSVSTVRDFSVDRLKDHGHAAIAWRLDYAAPDRYHVTQQAWDTPGDRYVVDEWISIGEEKFENALVQWQPSPEPPRAQLTQSLSLRNAIMRVSRIANAQPDRVESQEHVGENYWVLTFSQRASHGESANLDICGRLGEGSCSTTVWIDAKSNAIAGLRTAARGKDASQRPLHLESMQVFGCHDDVVQVDPPTRQNVLHHGGELNWSLAESTPLNPRNRSTPFAVAHKAPTGEPLARPPFPHMSYYRTEVKNLSNRPLRIVWYKGLNEVIGSWTNPGSGWDGDRFLKAYTEGDPVINGAILPGKTAACDVNWHGSHSTNPVRFKWAYIAVDPAGDTYYADAIVDASVIRN